MDNVYVCRCEDVTLSEVKDLLDRGLESIDEIKRICRCGMGPCGGKTCNTLLITELAKYRNINPADIKIATNRQPTENIKLGLIEAAGDKT